MRKILNMLLVLALITGTVQAQDFPANAWQTDTGTTAADNSTTTVNSPTSMTVRDICVVNTGATNNLQARLNGGSEYKTIPPNYGSWCVENIQGPNDSTKPSVGVRSANGVTTTYEITWVGSGS